MKRLAIMICALVLIASALGLAPAANAADGAHCDADPDRIAQGETAFVTCEGFSPNTELYVYAAEPDGTAVGIGPVKTNLSGVANFTWTNGAKGFVSLRLGTFTFVVEELGLGGTKLRQATVNITHIGDGEHVSGASLVSDQKVYDKSTESIVLTGSGFFPGEPVTLWLQEPAYCSSYTEHYVDGKNGATFENVPNYQLEQTYGVDTFPADANGGFVTVRFLSNQACHGTWRYAARGLNSGLGAYVEFDITGAKVSTSAFLFPSQDSVFAFNDTIEFLATGFAPNEILNCWSTSPEGRAIPFGIGGSLGQIKVNAFGVGFIHLTTGSHITSPDDPYFEGVEVEPAMSEGSLGWWALTCKGADSNLIGIARYRVDGLPLTP
jgi:hypothetical protein